MPTLFRTFADLCEKLASTTKRNAMVSWVAEFILQLETNELQPAISLLLGRVFPKWDHRVLEVSWATLYTSIQKIVRIEHRRIAEAFDNTEDMGDAVKILFEKGRVDRQTKLFQKQLTILEVHHTFRAVAETTGKGSRVKKERLLETLLRSMTPIEAKYVVKILIGEMRMGFHEGLMEHAVAQAFDISPDLVQKASMLKGDIGETATLAKAQGTQGLSKLQLQLFRPVKPMLAQMAFSVEDALEKHDGRTALEHKLDGARIQVHKSKNKVRIFSRRLTDVTESLPDVVALIRKEVETEKVVLEGEVIAVDKNGSPLLFQHLMRRFRRIRNVENTAKAVPVQLFLFDVLSVDQKGWINKEYVERREKLAEVAGKIPLVKQIVAEDETTAKEFFANSIAAGHEGLLAKRLDSLYTPGIRGKSWFKIKKVLESLELAIVAAEYGYGRRHGWLSDYYLAARDEENDELCIIGKTFKGLTDDEIIEMTQRLKKLASGTKGHKVVVLPKIVVEVAYNEIQKSSKYKCGMALRFARIIKIRDDKGIEEIDTLQKVKQIFENQFSRKARLSSQH